MGRQEMADETPALGEGPRPPWCSVRGKRAPWNEADVSAVAAKIVDSFTFQARELLNRPTWKGADLVVLTDRETLAPCREDLRKNFILMCVLCDRWPGEIPSGFMLADILLVADAMLGGKLLAPGMSPAAKVARALDEARKAKRLLQYLKDLWRRHGRSSCQTIDDLKLRLRVPGERGRLAPAPLLDASRCGTFSMDEDDASDARSVAPTNLDAAFEESHGLQVEGTVVPMDLAEVLGECAAAMNLELALVESEAPKNIDEALAGCAAQWHEAIICSIARIAYPIGSY